MRAVCAALLRALREPSQMMSFDADTWDRTIRQAEAAGLLGRLGALARSAGVADALPVAVSRHLEAALNLAEQQQRSVTWELVQLGRALERFPGPAVLLKGAAYAAANLAPAAGRLFSDIDLMVPKSLILDAESDLMLAGWVSSHHDEYDQRYYREWMHELPPMRHLSRQTVLDLHHNILPETARIKTQPAQLLAAAIPLPEFPGFYILAPADQVLHSATHLFHEGEWQHGLRDLADLDALLRDYANMPGFWEQLVTRAGALNLGRPLHYALRYAKSLLDTPVPAQVIAQCPGRPGSIANRGMDTLFLAAFASAHPKCRNSWTSIAKFFLYVRSHWLRMPAHLLLPHLIRKAWMARQVQASEDE